MSNPDEIRRDIERTRAELSDNVNALADNTKPANIARSQVEKVADGVQNLKEKVFGVDDNPYDDGVVGEAKANAAGAVEDAKANVAGLVGDAQAGVSNAVEGTQQAVAQAPETIQRKTRGNPLAAGLIAFGLGALAGGLIPATAAEKKTATELKEKAQPLVAEVKTMAADAAEQIKPVAQDAVATLKDSAAGAAETIKSEATDAADVVAGHAKDAAGTVKDEAAAKAEATKSEAKEIAGENSL